MRIFFTTPPIMRNSPQLAMHAPAGIMLMSALLKREGHDVEYVDGMIEDLDVAGIAARARAFSPDLVGVSLNALQMKFGREYTRALKKEMPDAPLVIGGPLIAAVPSESMTAAFPEADFAVYAEGEYAMLDLVSHLAGRLPIDEVRNLAFRRGAEIVLNRRERILDLDALPLPDYSVVEKYIFKYAGCFPKLADPSLAVICTRGCPFKCKFCSSPVTWDSKVVFRSVPSIIEECLMIEEKFGAKEIYFVDDLLNARREWFFSLCDSLIETGLASRVLFKGLFRANRKMVDEEILKKAKDAGFWMIFYGVESGDQQMLESMGKKISIEEIERAFDLTHRAGLKSVAAFLFGCPGDNRDTINATFRLIKKVKPDFGGMSVVIPFPGTELYTEVRELGLADNLDLSVFDYTECNIRTETLSNRELIRYASEGEKLVRKLALRKRDKILDTIYGRPAFRQRIKHRLDKLSRSFRKIMGS